MKCLRTAAAELSISAPLPAVLFFWERPVVLSVLAEVDP